MLCSGVAELGVWCILPVNKAAAALCLGVFLSGTGVEQPALKGLVGLVALRRGLKEGLQIMK